MRIKITNTEKLEAALSEVQAKCRTRCLDHADLEQATEKAEKVLGNICLCKSAWQGCTVSISPEKMANSYQGRAFGTACTLTRGSTGWFLTSAFRAPCSSAPYGSDRTERLYLTKEAKSALPSIYQL